MARRTTPPPPPEDFTERIVDIDVDDEMRGSFLEYAYSVIYSRALPDARDGLKPVQRRIAFQMSQMGLLPERPHVKSARVVGDVMGKLHPHGDSPIYDALVRMAQSFSLRLPLVDGHGNFGSQDAGPAASRYTEVRMAPATVAMTADLDEDVVDFVPNYDNTVQQPSVLPSAIPNLLVNGASGIAVGMATNMPPHNLVEVVAAARHLIARPDATLEDLMRFVPGPDLPTGGRIVGLDGVREAYATGRGTFRTRATAAIEDVTARRKGIVFTELPYTVGPEKVTEKIKDAVQAKRLQGISDVIDLTDRSHGLRLVVEVKTGFSPEAVLEQLYRLTPLEETFGINNVCLVDGQPRTLGLRELLAVYIGHRLEVVRRRSTHRLGRARDRLHLVEGLLVAIVDIDEVIQVVRTSDDAATARRRLTEVFDLDEVQAEYILELRLRRLTRFSRIELETEREELLVTITGLEALLGDEQLRREAVSDELAAVAREHGDPRRTVLLEGSAGAKAVVPLEVTDDPCWVLLSATGLLARTADPGDDRPLPAPGTSAGGGRAPHDVLRSAVRATARGEVGAVTSAGRVLRLGVVDTPVLPPTNGAPVLAGGAPLGLFLDLAAGEEVLALVPLVADGPGLALGTAQGVVKRVAPELPSRESWDVIALRDGDRVVGATALATGAEDLVLVTSDAQLLRFGADAVRPQGRAAAGVAGVRLAPGASVVAFAAVAAGA
ncbi:MAG: Topoisomerase IV subunit A, partial [uncultured Quadrisphaera sp.]